MDLISRQLEFPRQEYYRQRYDAVANEWDQTLARLGQNEVYQRLFEELQKRSWLRSRQDGYRILDVGIGSGALSLGLLTTTNNQTVHLTGIDISSAMLVKAKSNLNAVGVHPELRQEGVEQTILSQPLYDLVMSAHVLEHFDDPKPVLQKMTSLLKPGGRLLTVVTKKSLFGQWIRFKWGIHLTNRDILIQLLADVGLICISPIAIKSPRFGTHQSIVMMAIKPEA